MADTFSDDYYETMRKKHFQFDQELYDLSQDVLANDEAANNTDSSSDNKADPAINLTINKLRSMQNDRQEIIEKYVKVDEKRHQELVSYQNEIARRKAEAQQAIVRKVNSQPKMINKDENPTSNIHFIRPMTKNFDEQVLAKAQDKLNYTLQMDVLTADKIQEIKDINDRSKLLNNKFAKLDPFIHKVYIRLVGFLWLLVVAIILTVILI
jgi:hypothetical protein